jgi:hypothetical protein
MVITMRAPSRNGNLHCHPEAEVHRALALTRIELPAEIAANDRGRGSPGQLGGASRTG